MGSAGSEGDRHTTRKKHNSSVTGRKFTCSVTRGVPLTVLGPGLLIFAARDGDDAAQERLRAVVPPDPDFDAMARTVADALRASAWVRTVWDQAERVEALARR